jgi:hypothetical protein
VRGDSRRSGWKSFRGARTGDGAKMAHVRQAHDVARLLRLVHFEPLDVFHDLAKADQEMNLGLCVGLALQDVECPFDVLFTGRYVFAFHLKAPFVRTLELPFRAL